MARLPIPLAAVLLVAAAFASDLVPGLTLSIHTVELVASGALVVILFAGGASIGLRRFRAAAMPVVLLGLPGPLVSYRELGILRRLSTTPVPPSWLLAAQVVVQLCIALAGLAIVNIASVAAFGAPVPKSPGGLALSCLLAIGGLFALGLLIAALAPTANSVNAIGRLALIPLLFFAGLWLPRPLMPAVLLDISNYTPLGAAVEAIQGSVQTGFPPATPLLVLAGYTLVFAYLARRFFRWE